VDSKVVEIVQSLGLKSRIKALSDAVSDWNAWLIIPVPSYFEGADGPVSDKQIEWIDIDPIVLTRRGNLVPDLREDKKSALVSALVEREIQFEDMGEFLRIKQTRNQ